MSLSRALSALCVYLQGAEATIDETAAASELGGDLTLSQRVRPPSFFVIPDRTHGSLSHSHSLTRFLSCPWRSAQLAQLPQMVQGAQSSDPETQLDAVTKFRKLLSIGTCV